MTRFNLSLLIGLNLTHSNLVRLVIAFDRDLRGHTTHSSNFASVACLDK